MEHAGYEELLDRLLIRMIDWEKGRPGRIQHLLKVHAFAELIGKGEGADDHTLFLLRTLGYIHDLGIKTSEEREGYYNAKTQEKYGAIEARKVLTELGFAPEDVDRVSYVVGIHHTYDSGETGMDFRILLEADACVNMYEKDASEKAKYAMLEDVFRTGTGKCIFKTMFGLD